MASNVTIFSFQLTQKEALNELFSNATWSGTKSKDAADIEVLKHWDGANTNIYITLVIFIVLKVCGFGMVQTSFHLLQYHLISNHVGIF
jgi:hypothetical protein